jgi:hypothetical protein
MESMSIQPANVFRKSALCPPSQTLLAYRRSELTIIQSLCVEAHLAGCEFCGAESQLLDCFRHGSEEIACTEIPSQLRELAEQVLRNSPGEMSVAT